MDIGGILIAGILVGGAGAIIGVFLGVFGEKFKVEVDEKEILVRQQLPGNNCGGCGYAGCDGLAAAIAKGEAAPSACPVGGAESSSAISAIMGVADANTVRKTAFVKCAGDCEKAKEIYQYFGNEECTAMEYIPNKGSKGCQYGCMGYGTCVRACPFEAIHIVDGIARVDREKCRACGQCVAACPKHLIELVPYNAAYLVQCASKDKGKDVMQNCAAGCIACRLCEKNCASNAVTVTDNLASINTELCMQCGVCAQKCPKGIITGKSATIR